MKLCNRVRYAWHVLRGRSIMVGVRIEGNATVTVPDSAIVEYCGFIGSNKPHANPEDFGVVVVPLWQKKRVVEKRKEKNVVP